jgi:hypothetical protein
MQPDKHIKIFEAGLMPAFFMPAGNALKQFNPEKSSDMYSYMP